ncbi:vesicle transport through interaction with t-SNAREs homolog 1A-like [Ornithodoros turicata]|uniref:vesicle transport through interaction with t-SNAREs homolog 1A-like n=1 Tax=Ornithodoros turicata TaxID=34597 RepID=UPI003139BC3B
MASLLETFEQQYAALTSEITFKIAKIPNLPSGDKVSIVSQVERNLEEAHEVLEQMELEVQRLPMTVRPKFQNRVKSYQAELVQLKKELHRARIAYSDDVLARDELFGDSEGLSTSERQCLLDNTESLERSTNKLKAGHRLAIETEQIGAAILTDLSAQRDTIKRAREKLKETDHDIGKSSHVLTGMIRRALQNKFILYIVVGAVLLVIVLCIYFSVRRHF